MTVKDSARHAWPFPVDGTAGPMFRRRIVFRHWPQRRQSLAPARQFARPVHPESNISSQPDEGSIMNRCYARLVALIVLSVVACLATLQSISLSERDARQSRSEVRWRTCGRGQRQSQTCRQIAQRRVDRSSGSRRWRAGTPRRRRSLLEVAAIGEEGKAPQIPAPLFACPRARLLSPRCATR